ncbi:hypothetical protein CHARACLAT_031579 [Characodon lateralis]|uniref:Uncharacterized protein n=1 Tax=Characodon lateralis TaxID=208331 RepID=A0ABU7DNR4_9TELE|nr:hypothetical protein [Characodon lateralis]
MKQKMLKKMTVKMINTLLKNTRKRTSQKEEKEAERIESVEEPFNGSFCTFVFIHSNLEEFTHIRINHTETAVYSEYLARGSSQVIRSHTETTSELPVGILLFY